MAAFGEQEEISEMGLVAAEYVAYKLLFFVSKCLMPMSITANSQSRMRVQTLSSATSQPQIHTQAQP